jgi:3'(2'), 5'-bisphosphate nucleotidase
MNEQTRDYIQQFREPLIVNTGSSIKLLWVAEGKADLYPRLGPTYEWDTCAAHAVVKYAGGHVLKFGDSLELTYNKENLLNPFFVVH